MKVGRSQLMDSFCKIKAVKFYSERYRESMKDFKQVDDKIIFEF